MSTKIRLCHGTQVTRFWRGSGFSYTIHGETLDGDEAIELGGYASSGYHPWERGETEPPVSGGSTPGNPEGSPSSSPSENALEPPGMTKVGGSRCACTGFRAARDPLATTLATLATGDLQPWPCVCGHEGTEHESRLGGMCKRSANYETPRCTFVEKYSPDAPGVRCALEAGHEGPHQDAPLTKVGGSTPEYGDVCTCGHTRGLHRGDRGADTDCEECDACERFTLARLEGSSAQQLALVIETAKLVASAWAHDYHCCAEMKRPSPGQQHGPRCPLAALERALAPFASTI